MDKIGRFFKLSYGHPEGCADCHKDLFEDEQVAFVGGLLTCKPCVDKRIGETAIGQRALWMQTRGRKEP